MTSLKDRWRHARPVLISGGVAFLIRLLRATWRLKHHGSGPPPLDGPAHVTCGWHGRSMPFIVMMGGKGYHLFISPSRDGEILSRIATAFGFELIRGSTGREGARAAVGAIRVLREGGRMAMTPDGPRGPVREVQEGVVAICQRSGATFVAASVSARRAKVLRSWDSTMIPLPFAVLEAVWGPPTVFPAEMDPAIVREEMGRMLRECEDEADRITGRLE